MYIKEERTHNVYSIPNYLSLNYKLINSPQGHRKPNSRLIAVGI